MEIDATYIKIYDRVFKKMKKRPFKNMKKKVFDLARNSNTSLYEAFREILWCGTIEFYQYLEAEFNGIAKSEPESLYNCSYLDEDDYGHLKAYLIENLCSLFDSIVRKEWSKELEKRILKDQLEFYQNRIEEKKKYIKELDQKKSKNLDKSDKSAIETAKDLIQFYENNCEQIKKGDKISNELFASDFIEKRQNELVKALYF